ncbi:MAG TPA: tetratricopeptide repeat protein [Thermoanaerobaculia bacterium]|nr:tetratricopeptide repeat protein [Thermoanaerobaculia bacterium]
MTKDNLIFAAFGLFLGFVAAWLMFEKVTMRQPLRAVPGQAAAGAAPSTGMPGEGPASPGPSSGAPSGAPSGIPLDMSRLEQLQQQLQADPNNPDIILALAHTTYDIAQQVPNPAGSRPLWMQARDLYSHYVELRPQDPELPNILSDLGVAYQELGEFDQALEIFRRVQTMAPDHWQSLYNQVVVLAFSKKQIDEAKKVLVELQRVQPNNPDVQRLAAAVEQQRNAA